jgi:hypothetical protein
MVLGTTQVHNLCINLLQSELPAAIAKASVQASRMCVNIRSVSLYAHRFGSLLLPHGGFRPVLRYSGPSHVATSGAIHRVRSSFLGCTQTISSEKQCYEGKQVCFGIFLQTPSLIRKET